MKILLIYNEYIYNGGEDTNFQTLVKLLEEHGHKVYKFTKSSKSISNKLVSKLQVAVEMVYNPTLLNELEKIISTFKPDIAHVQNIYPLMNDSIYILLRKKNIPIVQNIYNYRYVCPKMSLFRDGKVCTDCVRKFFPYPSVQHACYHGSSGASFAFGLSHNIYKILGVQNNIRVFLFPSKFIRNFYIKNADIHSKKAEVIPNCYLSFNSEAKILLPKKPFILFYGRLTEEKGIPLLLKVMSKTPFIQLIIIGDGPLKELVQKFSEKNKNILFKGLLNREETIEFVKKSVYVVIPSAWYDVLPNVLIESYANKKPVIAPRFGVFTDLVKHNETGYHYEYNNGRDLKDKIEILYKNAKQIKKMGENAYKEYKSQYTPELYYERIIKLYTSILEN